MRDLEEENYHPGVMGFIAGVIVVALLAVAIYAYSGRANPASQQVPSAQAGTP